MTALAALFERNIVAVFFVYGLAFFSMGLAVLLESRRASEFRIARAMGFLAGFGLLHGVHEWLRMAQQFGGPSEVGDMPSILLGIVDVSLLALSFLLLVVFGARLIYAEDDGRTFPIVLGVTLFLIWVASALAVRWVFQPCPVDCLGGIDVLTRYMLGLPGALLAAWAMLLEQRAFRVRGMHSVGRDMLWAALAMFLYGFVGQTFTERSFLFPSTVINADLFLELFGIPVQLFRASTAAVIAVFVIRALRAFELESRQRLAMANEARLTAQREALEAQRRAQAETEQLNRELQAAVQDLSTLFELSRSLASTLDRTTLMEQAISRIAGSLPRIGAGMILLRERPDAPPQIVASSGYATRLAGDGVPTEEQARRVGEHVVDSGRAAASSDTRILDLDSAAESAAAPTAATANEDGPRTVGIPLEIQNRVAGGLVLSASADSSALTSRDISLCRTIASQLGIALENANLYREVQAREALRGEMLHRVVSAQEAERQRIARELHDETGQALTALGLGLAAASESVKLDPARAAEQLAELRMLSAQAITELHELVADLRPSVLDDLGLVPALRRQVQDFESRTQVEAEFTVEGGHRRTRPEVETVLFRIAQEALTNVAKHAKATRVIVSLAYGVDEVELEVQDDGQGFESDRILGGGSRDRRAWGLLGIQERVALVGGSVQIESKPEAGTTIRVRIPLRDEGAHDGHD